MSLLWKYLLVVYSAILFTLAASLALAEGRIPFARNLAPVVWAALIGAAVSGALLAVYHACVARRLRRILAGAERIERGERGYRIPIDGADELSAIASAMNRVAESSERAFEGLETTVAERTEDLRAVLAEVHARSQIVEEVNSRLAESDRRKTEFLTNVSHELRTPLNSILGFLRLLAEGLYEGDKERDEFLANAQISANHLRSLVTNVLSAARIEAGHLQVRPEPVHPADVLCDVVRIMGVQAREKGITLRIEADGHCLALADEEALRQLLVNLIGNALKFTDHGSITVRAREEGREVCVEVEDTGVGIPGDELERIFEKYHQVENDTTRRHGGAGLGLAIARELTHLMDGSITARSAGLGKGACFRVLLPSARTTAAPGYSDATA